MLDYTFSFLACFGKFGILGLLGESFRDLGTNNFRDDASFDLVSTIIYTVRERAPSANASNWTGL
jgi:hypothetical protein